MSCRILAMNEATFCPCPTNLIWGLKLKSFRLMALAEKISGQPSVAWLLVITLTLIYNKNRASEARRNTKYAV